MNITYQILVITHKHNIATKHQTLINKILSHLKIHIHMSHIDCKTQSYIWKSNKNYYKKILHLNSWSQRNRKSHESMYTIKTYNLIKIYIKHVMYIHCKCYVSIEQTTSILIQNHKYTSNNEHHKKHCKYTNIIHWTLHIKY